MAAFLDGEVKNLEARYIDILLDQLELDGSKDNRNLCNNLLTNGREHLELYRDEVIPDVFETQMADNSPLLTTLKQYNVERWLLLYSSLTWFIALLNECKQNTPDLYEQILTKISRYGLSFSNEVLFLTIHFLYHFKDEADMKYVWQDLIINGLKTVSDHCRLQLLVQSEKHDSILLLALQEYFRDSLLAYFKKHNINDGRRGLFSKATLAVAQNGWIDGLNDGTVKGLITPKLFKSLLDDVQRSISNETTDESNDLPLEDAESSELQSTPYDRQQEDTAKPKELTTITSATAMTNSISSTDNVLPSIDELKPSSFISIQQNPAVLIENNIPVTTNTEHLKEIDLIESCKQAEKFQLKDLVQAGELIYIQKTLKNIIENILQNYQSLSHLVSDFLTPIMYLLKRQQNLTDFMSILYTCGQSSGLAKVSLQELSKLSLRMFIHVLLLNSDVLVSRVIMSLLSKQNPIPLINLSAGELQIVPQVFHLWDTTFPTLLSFGIGPCDGKSTLLDKLFMCSFEQRKKSIYFQQTIDIDFGCNFIIKRPVNIADVHGIPTKQLIFELCDLFDGFILQVKQNYAQKSVSSLQEFINILPEEKFKMLIIRDTDDEDDSDNALNNMFVLASATLIKFELPDLRNQNDQHNRHIIDTLRANIFGQLQLCLQQQRSSLQNISSQRNQKQATIKRLLDVNNSDTLDNSLTVVSPLKNHLIQTVSAQPEKNYPVYSLFVEWCKLTQQQTKLTFYCAQNEEMFKLQEKSFLKHQELENSKCDQCGLVLEDFVHLLRQTNTLVNLDILSSELKFEKNLRMKRSTEQVSNDLSVEKVLSIELLWRNAIVCYKFQSKENQNLIRSCYQHYIEAGFPFEIIDGDNFYLQYKFLTDALSCFKGKKVLIISIIGPQNSGKSTLLNYMFGTLFDVRDGRCTRGIYGSLVKSNSKDFDYIMLIDTEGLSSGETEEDSEYDRRIVLFCLAVSHLVIVNIKGELDKSMKKLITLCADSLQNVGVSRVPEPIVHFVLNQKAFSLDINDNDEVIKKLLASLRTFNLENVIKITKDTFHTLPIAYTTKLLVTGEASSPSVTCTVPEFIQYAQLLCGKLMNSATVSFQKSATQFTDPPQWLDFSYTLFDVLLKFPDLTYFIDVHEKNQDSKVRDFIRKSLEKKLTADERRRLVEDTRTLKERELCEHVDEYFDRIKTDSEEELEVELKTRNATNVIRKRSREFLTTQLTGLKNAWRIAALQENDRVKTEQLWRTGGDEMRTLVEHMIASGQTETLPSAGEKFEQMYEKHIQSIRQKFDKDERLQSAIKFIYSNYHCFEKQNLPSSDYILKFALYNPASLDSATLVSKMREIFLEQISKHPNIENQQQTPVNVVEYSLSMIAHLNYLNRKSLIEKFTGFKVDQFLNLPTQPNKINSSKKNKSTLLSWAPPAKKFAKRLASIIGHPCNDAEEEKFLEAVESKLLDLAATATAHIRPSPTQFRIEVIRSMSEDKDLCFKTQTSILPLILIFDFVYQHVIEILLETGTNVASINIDTVQKIVGFVNSILKEVNIELNLFGVSLSRHAVLAFHLVNVVLLSNFYFEEQIEHFNQQKFVLEYVKPSLKSYFIRMVVPNIEMDSSFAESITKQIFNLLEADLKQNAKSIIANAVQDDTLFTRKNIQNVCDLAYIERNDDEWHMNYIMQPDKGILDVFEMRWKSKKEAIELAIQVERDRLCNVFQGYLSKLQHMLQELKKENKSGTKFVDDSFSTNGGNANKNLINKGACMAKVLYSYLSNQKIEKTYEINNIKYELQNANKYQMLSLGEHTAVIDLMNQKAIEVEYKQCSISNFFGFLEKQIECGKRFSDEFKLIPIDFNNMDSEDIYRKMKSQALGCAILCPCCSRQCDADHSKIKAKPGSEFNKHSCTTGHQFRCMGGFKLEFTNEASVKMCEQMKDDEEIITTGNQRRTWKEFKLVHDDWKFGNEQSLTVEILRDLEQKYISVWNRIGKEFCRKYYPDMVFVNKNHEHPRHFILLLDNSGSMHYGGRWSALLKAVEDFVRIRNNSITDDRMSLIIFGSTAVQVFCNEELRTVNVMSKIKEKDGKVGNGTDFRQPFSLLIRTIETARTGTQPVAFLLNSVIFLTDGEASYPEKELEELKNKYGKSICNFWTMGYGNSRYPVLEKINEKMHGVFKNISNPADVIPIFAEIASNRPLKNITLRNN